MADDKLFIPLILGTPRMNRESEHVAKWVFAKMKERTDIEAQSFDVRDFELPRDQYGTEIGHLFPEWRDAIIRADGLVVVTPEYNHGYPAPLKNVLDHLLGEWGRKPIGFVSHGAASGGARAVEQLRQVAVELGMVPLRRQVAIPRIWAALDERGVLRDPPITEAEAMLNGLGWWATRLRAIRTGAAVTRGATT